jgi:arsenate reductase (glutaredoxin)
MSKRPLSADELRALVGDRDIVPFLNPRNDMYRELGMKANPPAKGEAIALMAENPNLIRRPLLLEGARILYGFDEASYRALKA